MTMSTVEATTPGLPALDVVLKLDSVDKHFGSVKALDRVTFDVRRGEVHALLGENGAGKSTLVGVAAGVVIPDGGTISIRGQKIDDLSPNVMTAEGVRVVRQRPDLIDDLSVAENIYLSLGERGVFHKSDYFEYCHTLLDHWGMGIDPQQLVVELSMQQRFVVEIARALAAEPSILFLDEPTEHLNRADIDRLFDNLRALKESGTAIVYISHRLNEVNEIADRITVLRDGASLETFGAQSKTQNEIVTIMVGRRVDTLMPDKAADIPADAAPCLEVEDFSGEGFHGISFVVRPGEIVGLAGIAGSGQAEILRALAGLNTAHGTVKVDGERISTRTVGASRRGGIAYIPSDRQQEGLVMPLSIAENISFGARRLVSRGGIVSRRLLKSLADTSVKDFDIKVASPWSPVESLSGGNQQKVVFAKTMATGSRILLAEEPTQGVDVRTRAALYRVLRDFVNDGGAVVLVTTDVVEASGLCDRLFVIERGGIEAELIGDQVTERGVTAATVLTEATVNDEVAGRGSRLRRLLAVSDYAPPALLAIVAVILAVGTNLVDPSFLSERNIGNMLVLLAPLLMVAIGQSFALLLGAIDLSIGPLSALILVVGSFFFLDRSSPGTVILGILAIIGTAALVGLVNGVLTRALQMNPVIGTLVTYIALQGLGTLLRPVPAGVISTGFADALGTSIGIIPVALIVGLVVMVLLELWLRRTRSGIRFRAVGSNPLSAQRLGVSASPRHYLAFLISAGFALAAGVLLMSQIGIGDPSVGTNYSLNSVAAAVLGGVSLFGARGSLIGSLLGSVLLVLITTAATFLRLGSAWQFALQGIVILIGVAAYSTLRRRTTGGAS